MVLSLKKVKDLGRTPMSKDVGLRKDPKTMAKAPTLPTLGDVVLGGATSHRNDRKAHKLEDKKKCKKRKKKGK